MWPCCHGLYPLIISVIMQNRIMYTSVWIILQCRSLGTTFPLINCAWILCHKFISWPSYIGNIKIMKTSFIFIWDQSTIINFWVFFFLFFDFVEHLNLCCTYTHEIQTNQYKKIIMHQQFYDFIVLWMCPCLSWWETMFSQVDICINYKWKLQSKWIFQWYNIFISCSRVLSFSFYFKMIIYFRIRQSLKMAYFMINVLQVSLVLFVYTVGEFCRFSTK